jgi:hypothetical protein
LAEPAQPSLVTRRQERNTDAKEVTRLCRSQKLPENILILADWTLAGLVDDAVPRETPTGMMTEEDEERNDQPPVVREPESDE